MKFKLTLAALIIAPLMLTACAKQEEAKNTEQPEQTSTVATQTTPEQQAAIDALDKPNVSEETSAPVESPTSEVAASEIQ